MRTALLLLSGPILISLAGCASSESFCKQGYDFRSVERIAVVDVVGRVGGEAAKNQIADMFVMELLKKGYSPIERAQVQVLLKEQKFQASDVTSAENVSRAGEILNVPVVLVINVPKFEDNMTISAKMLSVEDGSVLWMGSGNGGGGKMLPTILGAAAGAVAGGAVVGQDDRAVGAIAGGVAGGVLGNLLGPEKEQVARKVVKKICKSMPERMPAVQANR
ncbi:MAG: CsgG/HfaB family protein [Planctomycetaceae bacterium]|nr:CsgG/HfaB family protein [Planctomycetaceae bacterium]